MRKIGIVFMTSGSILFLFFQLVIVKIACFKYPLDFHYGSFWQLLVAAYTQDDIAGGVLHEIYGPVSGMQTFVYLVCFLMVILGVIFLFRKPKV